MVCSQFQHCSAIWRPCSFSDVNRFEGIQKRAIKWILSEEHLGYYSSFTMYLLKCVEVKHLPIEKFFNFNDLILFYKIIHNLIPFNLPGYIVPFNSSDSRLRSSHMDHLCYNISISPSNSRSPICSSYFFRTVSKWNNLPFDLRKCETLSSFRTYLNIFLWREVLSNILDDANLDLCISNLTT